MAVTQAQIQAAVNAAVAAVSAVPTFTTAPRSEINSVLLVIAAAQSLVSQAISEADALVLGAASASVSGVVGAGAGMAATLVQQVAVVQRLPQLGAIQSRLGRMAKNLTSAGTSGFAVTQGGGTLYALAVQACGDVTAWPDIATANGLTDPVLTGVNQIVVPPTQTGTGGVLRP